jgi:hypothetical protein
MVDTVTTPVNPKAWSGIYPHTGVSAAAGKRSQQAFVQPEITGNYGVGVEAFEDAATKLGMDPDDLQAMMWFREKEIWESGGFATIDDSADLNQLLVAGRRVADADD